MRRVRECRAGARIAANDGSHSRECLLAPNPTASFSGDGIHGVMLNHFAEVAASLTQDCIRENTGSRPVYLPSLLSLWKKLRKKL
ncbi:hypothetical protein [Paraburkholderia jirisanensis]